MTQPNEIITRLNKEHGQLLFPIILNDFDTSLEQGNSLEPSINAVVICNL